MRGARAIVLGSLVAAAWACGSSGAGSPATPGDDAGPPPPAPPPTPGNDGGVDANDGGADPTAYHAAADAALEALLLGFWSGDYLRATRDAASPKTGYWIFAQTLDAICDSVTRTAGGWDIYGQVSVPVVLGANSTISIVYDSSKGSHQFLNVDRILLKSL